MVTKGNTEGYLKVPYTTTKNGVYYLNLVDRERRFFRISLRTRDGNVAYCFVRKYIHIFKEYIECKISREDLCQNLNFQECSTENSKGVNKKHRKMGDYFCEVCSVDELVQAKLCDGIFKTQVSNLKRGSQPCRCSGHFNYTKDQLTFLLQKRIRKLNLPILFLAWEHETNVSTKSKFRYVCEQHGVFSIQYSNFIRRPSCCPVCAGKNQKECYINLISDNLVPRSLKFGIAKDSKHRLKIQNQNNTLQMEQLHIFEFPSVQQCKDAEKACKDELQCGILNSRELKDGWTETTSIQNLDKIIEIYKRFGGILVKDKTD